jgi:hypothetical protein
MNKRGRATGLTPVVQERDGLPPDYRAQALLVMRGPPAAGFEQLCQRVCAKLVLRKSS